MPFRPVRLLLPIVLVTVLLVPLAGSATPLQQLSGRTMGTTWSVTVAAAPGRLPALREGVQARLDEVVAQMSTWEPDSDLSRYNRAPAGSWHPLPAPAAQVVDAALALARESAGAFDPTVGPLVDAWGYGPAGPQAAAPPPEALAAARARVGWQHLRLLPDGRLWQPGGVNVDLSAIAKGYGVDRVAEWLLGAGVESFLVEVGGELRGHGRKPDGSPWRVAVERPAPDDSRLDDVQLVVRLDGLAVATSGDYRHRDERDGRSVSHIIDPRTGAPVTHALAAVTVLHPQAMQADALATTLQVLGPRQGLEWARTRGLAALLVWHEGEGFGSAMTPAFAGHVVQP
ncbi:FAD:protein FMN transferase [Lysobacter sp. GX 14042]|uniref:FAD:protein FMN transferase n=1 Tax=Lysobacter sp. GX 14042 TaxID=2907155 RepID=UPI001F2B042C|nr:FAD:protein FMN transferase [Lysobacter sp. GX 14042]MCE7031840.1 FAD:protein FMN transferase [Lysobacter sp. GX 14042]